MQTATKQALQEVSDVLRDLAAFLTRVENKNEVGVQAAVGEFARELDRLANKGQRIGEEDKRATAPHLRLVVSDGEGMTPNQSKQNSSGTRQGNLFKAGPAGKTVRS